MPLRARLQPPQGKDPHILQARPAQQADRQARARRGGSALPLLSLRFSACRGYSPRFADIVRAAAAKYPFHAAICVGGGCGYCKGEPETHVYIDDAPDGGERPICGAYALAIPDITPNDLDEIKRLIREEHDYLLRHEVDK